MATKETTEKEPFHRRIEIGDDHNEDRFRDVTVMATDDVSITVNSIGLHFSVYVTPDKARAIAAALIEAADAIAPAAAPEKAGGGK
jgi:hypothetical protein